MMVNVILALLALVIVELAILVVVVIWRVCAGERPSEGTAFPPAVPPTSDEEDRSSSDFERRFQDTMNQMMGYDVSAAKRAVRRDGDEDDE